MIILIFIMIGYARVGGVARVHHGDVRAEGRVVQVGVVLAQLLGGQLTWWSSGWHSAKRMEKQSN